MSTKRKITFGVAGGLAALVAIGLANAPSHPPAGSASTPAKGAEAAPVPVGRPADAAGVRFTVTDVATPRQIGAFGMGPKAEPGETFVVVSYTVKNTSGRTLAFADRPDLSLVDGAGHTYAQDTATSLGAALGMADASGASSDLNPNVSARTKAAWKVDRAAFDRGSWRLVVAADPQLAFALR